MRFILCIPTWNSEKKLRVSLPAILNQTLLPSEFWVIDSSSEDCTVSVAQKAGAKVHVIPQAEFNHGGTRNLFLKLASGDCYLYLTDDAIPAASTTFENLIHALREDSSVGIAYGRQLPYPDATPFAAHARLFNYPESSISKSFADRERLGIKTSFCSDSFAAYRTQALEDVGGFPTNVIVAEDAYLAARILQKGWKVYYAAEACVRHSHNYSVWQEFKRYFDIGVFYGREKWILDAFGKAEGEGKKFLLSELHYLKKNKRRSLYPEWFFRNGMKWLGYRLGVAEKYLPLKLKKTLSMHRGFWREEI